MPCSQNSRTKNKKRTDGKRNKKQRNIGTR
uniref:Uncharacterized protein n=1 Tax=Arundo donax TaxID=35708 RepID=A0A0A8Y1A3_ARUDO